MASKKASKGKRYTDDEKQRIVAFVHQINQEKGRGGLTAAAKKFGVSALTVGAWLKASGEAGSAGSKNSGKVPSGRNRILDQLAALDREITMKRSELVKLEAAFQKLKAKL